MAYATGSNENITRAPSGMQGFWKVGDSVTLMVSEVQERVAWSRFEPSVRQDTVWSSDKDETTVISRWTGHGQSAS